MQDFFDKCLSVNANFTRIDIAIDDYKTYLKVPLLIKKAEKLSVFHVLELEAQ